MNPYYTDPSVTVYAGDCLDVMRELPDASVDAVVCDPPYGLEFMGKEWDGADGFRRSLNLADAGRDSAFGRMSRTSPEYRAGVTFQSWCELWAAECLRVLKPGGHLLAFGGTRTYHRLACAVEDAGFEIRDSISWLYGSGFPKSLDVSKAIDKAAGAEREVVGKTGRCVGPSQGRGFQDSGTFREPNWQASNDLTAPATDEAKRWAGWGTALKPAHEPIVVARKPLAGTVAGNVVVHGTGALNIDGCRVAHASVADLATSQAKNPGRSDSVTSGVYGADRPQQSVNAAGRWPTNVLLDQSQADALDAETGISRDGVAVNRNRGPLRPQSVAGVPTRVIPEDVGYGGSGGASRFFPTFRYEAKAPQAERPRDGATVHPTVKPLDLMRWLVRLVTPRGGVVLDPFLGSGTTAEACVLEHLRCIGIEREAAYLPLTVARLRKPLQLGFDFGDD